MKTRLFPYVCLLLAAFLMFALPQAARAQDQQYEGDQQDGQAPPTRVAELDDMQGSVSYEPSGEQNWVQAEINRPLTTGDNLWTDQDSRAELVIGSTAFRMGDSTGISFLNLNDQAVQVQLAEGTLEVDVRYLNPGEAYEIDSPNLAFSIVRPGEYRLQADPNGASTIVTVYSGQGSVTGGGQTYNVSPGQRAIFSGSNELSENVEGIPAPDAFHSWARSREMRYEHSTSLHYVSAGVTGYEDLDAYGSWRSDPEYGNYWVPNDVASDWIPYHVGHWAWIAPWGWTWVDAEPWGFAPFHYGRWAEIEGRWGWVPGPVAVAPVYAPALVGFVGGGGFGVAVAFGSTVGVGWYPLGPRDVYVPAYQVDERYVERINDGDTRYVNRTSITTVYNNYTVNHITNVNYTYANNARAVTVVSREGFVSGRRVEHSAIRVNAEQINHPRVITTAALTPSRTSVVGAAVAPARRQPPVRAASQRVVTKLKPSPRAEPIGRPRPSTNPNLTNAVLQRSGYSPQLQLAHARAAASAPARGTTPESRTPNALAPNGTARPGQPPARPEVQPVRPTPNRPGIPSARPAPNQPTARPGIQPARPTPGHPGTEPARPGQPGRPEVNPSTFPPSGPAPNNARPTHPFTPPNRPGVNPRPAPNQPRPAFPPRNRPAEPPRQPQPGRAFTPPNRPPTQPNRPTMPPNRPSATPNRPAERPQPRPTPSREMTPRPPAREPVRPQPRPKPEARPPAARPPVARPAPRPAARPQPPPKEHPQPKKKPGGPDGPGS
ncbi:MAG TPA: DUF6600 domain-containing protein [Candidatus Acidoferrales bacterium]|nr:DUF6600 domain-containing protein [Candidatus Acidoferrales bacterium]